VSDHYSRSMAVGQKLWRTKRSVHGWSNRVIEQANEDNIRRCGADVWRSIDIHTNTLF
jgi:hypothetical protein